jgi:hypothetical protein
MSHEPKRRLKVAGLIAIGHAVVSAFLWMWALGVTGLGFKDRADWTTLDQLQAALVPALAFTITAPGRFFIEVAPGWWGIVLPWLLNSALWAALLVGLWSTVQRWRNAT